MIKKGQENNIVQEIDLPDMISAPIHKGDVLGKVTFHLNDQVIQEINIIAGYDVDSANFWNITTNLYERWFNMLR